ncbi:hypothetical protein OCU04_011912 [Sclerotinia nivalis]|uniref:Uncharacterized protein n=1 Tax=Sclerotinia nivalis TaxID=352851 RepID=A0A9X0AA16_9HELO|nr:hypothetical protein OCU04_011912 [Sclerotinia nivalis]
MPDILCINREIRIDALKGHGYYIYEETLTTRECLDYAHHPERCLEIFGPQDIPKLLFHFHAKTDMLYINSGPQGRLPGVLESLTPKVKENIRCTAVDVEKVWDKWNECMDPITLKNMKEFRALELLLVVVNSWEGPGWRANIVFEETDNPYYWATTDHGIMLASRQKAAIQSGLAREEDGVLVTPEVKLVIERYPSYVL